MPPTPSLEARPCPTSTAMTMDHSASNIPIVDFGRYINGTEHEKHVVAAAIDSAFQNFGFVYLTNHGIPQEKIDECFTWALLSHQNPAGLSNIIP
jgi:hypothetical protein